MNKTIALLVLALLFAGCSKAPSIGDGDPTSGYPTAEAACASLGADRTVRITRYSAICYKDGRAWAAAFFLYALPNPEWYAAGRTPASEQEP